MKKQFTPQTVITTWKPRTFDVWGNAKDGYEVNDTYEHAEIELEIPVTANNVGTPAEFLSAYPTDKQLREVFGIKPRVQLALDGDDLNIEVSHRSTAYPFGSLECTSHESLSLIRAKGETTSV